MESSEIREDRRRANTVVLQTDTRDLKKGFRFLLKQVCESVSTSAETSRLSHLC